MPDADFQHLRLSVIENILLIEVLSADIQGPDRAKEFIAELTAAINQEPAGPIVLDLSRTSYFSSMGYAALFKAVKQAKERNRPICFCSIHPDVCTGAEIVGLGLVVQSHDCRESALEAFRKAGYCRSEGVASAPVSSR